MYLCDLFISLMYFNLIIYFSNLFQFIELLMYVCTYIYIYIYINNIFLFVDTAFLENYTDGTTLYSIQKNPKGNQAFLNYNFTSL